VSSSRYSAGIFGTSAAVIRSVNLARVVVAVIVASPCVLVVAAAG
jgi:hypothetical protein